MIAVTCTVGTADEKRAVRVEAVDPGYHWKPAEMVKLTFGKENIEVNGQDLIRAIKNCLNSK